MARWASRKHDEGQRKVKLGSDPVRGLTKDYIGNLVTSESTWNPVPVGTPRKCIKPLQSCYPNNRKYLPCSLTSLVKAAVGNKSLM